MEERELRDVTSVLNNPETMIYLEINAIALPVWKEETVTIFKKTIKAKDKLFIRSEELGEISKAWISISLRIAMDLAKGYGTARIEASHDKVMRYEALYASVEEIGRESGRSK
ncbi:MAG: hypothetical protein QXO16_04585 [Archaeoglobaceae archaeon]